MFTTTPLVKGSLALIGHPYLRLHSFHGWPLTPIPDIVMSHHGASFAVSGTDFPIDCT